MTEDRIRVDVGLAELIDSELYQLHTAMPGQITAFNETDNTVSVQPCLKRKYEGEDSPVSLPIIEDVPIVYPGSGDYWIVFEPEIGDCVMLVASERSIATWLNQGGVVDPGVRRRHNLSDVVAIPGLNPSTTAISSISGQGISLRSRDGTHLVKLSSSGVYLTTTGPGGVPGAETVELLLSVFNGRIVIESTTGGKIEIKANTGQVEINSNFTVDV